MRAAVLGKPIAHSLSPVLHRAAYERLGLTGWSYEAIECDSPGLATLLERARRDPEFGGYSLTMPLKVTAMGLVDDLEPLAVRVGAVNTVVPREGRLYGANTDVPGMVNALAEAGVVTSAHPVILGGGGSAQAAVAALALLRATAVEVAVRNPDRAGAVLAAAGRVGLSVTLRTWSAAAFDGADLVISTVPAGAAADLGDWAEAWPAGAVLFDLLYAPWPTPLAVAAAGQGARVVGGVDLLVHQAVGQVKLMTEREIDPSVLRAAAEQARTGG